MGKLYIGNLPFSTTEDQLKAVFEKVGEVKSAVVITDRETGRSRGFGFVDMDKSEEAMAQLNETPLDGRNLKVSPAKEKQPRENRGGREDDERGSRRRY